MRERRAHAELELAFASVGRASRFLALEPGRRIVQSVEFDSTDAAHAGEMIMTSSFEPTAAGTKVTIRAEDVPPGISRADHGAGLRASLENLARFVQCPHVARLARSREGTRCPST